ncbi:unnamed protein product, partial [Ectocarpus sp. 12 AP-2014]
GKGQLVIYEEAVGDKVSFIGGCLACAVCATATAVAAAAAAVLLPCVWVSLWFLLPNVSSSWVLRTGFLPAFKFSAFVALAKVHPVVVRKLATVGDECREFVLGGALVCR